MFLQKPETLTQINDHFHSEHYLWNVNPGKISMFVLRAARFNADIPLTDKHVNISSLFKQFANILRNDIGSSFVGAATATANIADNTKNAFILIEIFFFHFNTKITSTVYSMNKIIKRKIFCRKKLCAFEIELTA